MSIDVTEHAELEQLREATRVSGLFTWSCDLGACDLPRAKVTFIGVRDVLGYDALPAELGTALDVIVIADDRARVLDELRRFLCGAGERYETEYRIRHADGSVHWMLARCVAVRANGRAVRFSASCVDVTRTRREAEHLELATKLSGVAVLNYDLGGGDLAHARSLADSNVLDVLGYPRDSAPVEFAAGLRLAILPEDHERVLAAMQACVDGTTPMFEAEYRVRHKDGTVLWRLGRGVTIRDDQGRPLRYTGTSVDVTRLKQAEAEAQRVMAQLRLTTELSGVSMWSYDLTDGDAKSTAGSALHALGYGVDTIPADWRGRVALAVLPEDQQRVLDAVQDCIDGKTSMFEVECRAHHADRSVGWLLARGVTTRDDAGRPIAISGTAVDVTRIKVAEENARGAQQLLELGMSIAGLSVVEIDRRGIAPEDGIVKRAGDWEHRGMNDLGPVTLVDFMKRTIVEEDLPAALDQFFAVNRGTKSEPLEFRSRSPLDGSIEWRLGLSRLICADDGAPVRYIAVTVDIQKVKTAEETARRAIEQLRLATRLSDVYLWNFELVDGDLAKAKITTSDAWESLGYQPEDVPSNVGSGMSAVFIDDQPRVWAALQASVDGKTEQMEVYYRTHHVDGALRWNLARGVTIRDAAGKATRILGTIVDVTLLKHAEEDVRIAEEQAQQAAQHLRLATDLSSVGVWGYELVNGDLATAKSTFVIDGVMASLGYGPDEFEPTLPSRLGAVVVPEDQPRMQQALGDYFAGKTPQFDVECRFIHKNGSIVWRLVRGIVTRDEEGRPLTFMGTAVDITQLKESEARFRGTFENAAVGMAVADVHGTFLEANSRFADFLGYPRAELENQPFGKFMIPEEVAHDTTQLQRVARGEAASHMRDKRYLRKDGTVVWATMAVSVIQRDGEGKPSHMMAILQDITERKELEAEIEKSKMRLELAMRGSDIAVYHGEFLDASPETAQWTYFNMWEPLGFDAAVPEEFEQRRGLAIHPDDQDAVTSQFAAAVERRSRDLYTEHRVLHRDGSVRWRLSRGTLVYDEAGTLTSLVGTEVDITRLKQIEGDLLRAREAAESANRAKDEFLANVSHEIRTPMNAILGMTELAIDSAPSEHQRQLLSTVRSAAKNLLTIINDLLDFSKIASGKLTLDSADFSLRAAVGDTLRALAVRAHRKGLELLCHVGPNVPDALEGDAGRLRQVLMNLVGNAIKFTPQGEVEVDVAAEPSSSGSVSLIFSVRDTGIGIARDKQEAIFHAFEQEDSSTTRKYGGTGLGLTISAQLATLMDGDITVQSAPGCGSTFRFTARFARSMNPDATTASPERLASLRVLVVDDNAANRRILVEWLTSWRMQPTSVGSAAQAIAALASAYAAGTPFALVLLDARMPDGDGVSLAREIRQRWEAGAPRLILLSSDDNAELATLAKDNGVLAYLLKPVQQSELLEAIWSAMNLELTPGSDEGQPEGLRPLRILVAEDNELNVTLLRELLSQRKHIAQFAHDGRAALELALQGEFDLMLLDLHMPELDGFEVVEAIRDHERGTNQHLRIIALTARSSARDRERCLAAGMDEFLAKPIEATALSATMERLVAKWPLATPRAVDPGPLDARAILRACGRQANILEKLRVVFRRTLPVQMARVRSALASGSFQELREAAHQLVATVGAFSAVAAGVASALEDAAIREDRGSCTALVVRLGSLCDALLNATETLTLESLAL